MSSEQPLPEAVEQQIIELAENQIAGELYAMTYPYSHEQRRDAVESRAETLRDLARLAFTAGRLLHEWQPIETAPKDGTEIVALVSGVPYFVSWTTHGKQHAEPWWRDREGYGLTEPTHWAPLPALPGVRVSPSETTE